MKNIWVRGIAISFALITLVISIFIIKALPILTGYNAKIVCSCIFVSGRSAEDVLNTEVAFFPFSLATIKVDKIDSTISASVWGLGIKKAIYRKGLGCTLVNEGTEASIKTQPQNIVQKPQYNQDSIMWPSGNLNADSLFYNIDTAKINRALNLVFQQKNNLPVFGTRSIIVLYQGKIISEKHVEGFNGTMPQIGWSMTKSVTNALVGILVKEKKLNVNDRNLFPEWLNDNRKNITIDNLLHANSGLQWREVYTSPSSATTMLYQKDDMARYALNFPLEEKPGTHFRYSSGTSNILSYLIRQKTGSNYYRFAYNQLFYKLGMFSAILEPDASGTYVGSSYCFASARDWARFGLFYLNDGIINGERILPVGWIKYTTTPSAGAKQGEYGAQFWLNAGEPGNPSNRTYPDVPADCFFAEGYQGQEVWIIPSKQLVVVRLSMQNKQKLDENKFLSLITKAIK